MIMADKNLLKYDNEIEKVVNKFAADRDHWQAVKSVLLEEIQNNRDDIENKQKFIELVEAKILEYENHIIKRN
jgi:hypothetical protein